MAHQSGTVLRKARREREYRLAAIFALNFEVRRTSLGKAIRPAPPTSQFHGSARRGRALTILSYIYRFLSNFAFLAVVYFALNFLTKYEERTIIAALVLTYSIMRVVSALRQFHFFSRIERLEAEARAAFTNVTDSPAKKQAIREVSALRHQGELKAYMDLLFLGLISLLCIAKIVGN
jgi:hypothetical protein